MSIALIASQGGHLGQMKLIFTEKILQNKKAVLITENEKDLKNKEKGFLNKYPVYYFKKDHLGFNPFNYLRTLFRLIKIFKKEKIKIIITNGAQISIPSVIAARLLGIKSVFIDTVIRVKTPNWSARACYLFADIFLVQHANMAKKYGKRAKFIGGIV